MATINQVQRGIETYVTNELLPKAEGRDKWILSGATVVVMPRITNALKNIADQNGNIDVNAIVEAIRPAAKTTSAKFSIPFGAECTLTESDLDKLKHYIMQA